MLVPYVHFCICINNWKLNEKAGKFAEVEVNYDIKINGTSK